MKNNQNNRTVRVVPMGSFVTQKNEPKGTKRDQKGPKGTKMNQKKQKKQEEQKRPITTKNILVWIVKQ